MFSITVSALSFVLTQISDVLLAGAFGAGLATPTAPRPMAKPLALKAALRIRHIRPDSALKIACLYISG